MEFTLNQAPPKGWSWIYIINFYTRETDQLFAVYIGTTETPISGRTGTHFANSFLGSSREKCNSPAHKLVRMCGEERVSVKAWGIVPTCMAKDFETILIQKYKNISINVSQKKQKLDIDTFSTLVYCVNPDDYDVEKVYLSPEDIANEKGLDLFEVNNAIDSKGTICLGNRLYMFSTDYEPPENKENLYFDLKDTKESYDIHSVMLRDICLGRNALC